MSKFGFSYPAGVSSRDIDDMIGPCETCGLPIDDCICPECPVCGESGNTFCYDNKHLRYTRQQRLGQAKARIRDFEFKIADEGQYIAWLEQQPSDWMDDG